MKVVMLSPLWRDELAAMLDAGPSLVAVDPADEVRLAHELPDAQIVLTTRFNRELASLCRSLKLVLCPAAGTEGIDRAALPAGVTLKSGVGHEIPMAEYVIGGLVALRQRFQAADAALRADVWRFGFFGSRGTVDELYDSTLGIIGFGRIGAEVARRARAFGMRCRAVTLHPDKSIEAGLLMAKPGDLSVAADVDALVTDADAVAIACEYSPLTHGLMDARRLGRMRKSAVLVNVARGPILDERALYEALESRRIAAAAIDVWYHYPDGGGDAAPPSDFPFRELDNVLMTPHSSGWTPGANQRKLAFLARCINEMWRSR